MADNETTETASEALPPTRAQRLAKQRDTFLNWARQTNTDEIPADLSPWEPKD